MELEIERDTDVLRIQDQRIAEAGVWNIAVNAWTPSGFRRYSTPITASVTHSVRNWSAPGVKMLKLNAFAADITGLGLQDFTKVNVTATSQDGKHTTWLTLSRKP